MCEQADTFCKNTCTDFVHFLHLNVNMRAGLLAMFIPVWLGRRCKPAMAQRRYYKRSNDADQRAASRHSDVVSAERA